MIQPYKVAWNVVPVKGNNVGHDDYEIRAYTEYAGVTYGAAGRIGNVMIWTLMRSGLTKASRARMFRALVADNVQRMTQDIWDRIYHYHKDKFMEGLTLDEIQLDMFKDWCIT